MKVSQAIPLSEKLSKKTSFPEKWKACFFIGMGYKNAHDQREIDISYIKRGKVLVKQCHDLCSKRLLSIPSTFAFRTKAT